MIQTPNYKSFKIRGTNIETKRSKTITVNVPNIYLPEKIALECGIIEPYTITEIPFEPPSKAQLSYARDLGLIIPEDATKIDLSALISLKTDNDSTPKPGLIEFATNRGMMFSNYIGKKALYDLIFSHLSLEDRVAFFCFSIYRYLSDDRHSNLDTSPKKDHFFKFAKDNINNKQFTSSVNKYEGVDLRFFGLIKLKTDNGYLVEVQGGSINTNAYKITADYLHNIFGLPKTKIKILENNKQSQTTEKNISFKNDGFIGVVKKLLKRLFS